MEEVRKKRKLNIWLIKEGEALPISGSSRLMRMGLLAEYLSANGHNVIWWTSGFMHQEKSYICRKNKKYKINDNETLICLHSSISYKKNISVKRIVYHKILGQQFKRLNKRVKKPDIILCAWPLADFAKEAIRYGKINNVPVILDARDQWPDIFVRAFSRKMQKMGELALMPLKRQAANLFRNAYGITSPIEPELRWACRYAGREPGSNDRTIYIGNRRTQLSEKQLKEALEGWAKKGIRKSDWILCFFSTFGSHIAIDIVIKAVKELSRSYPRIHLVIGGGGDRETEFKKIAGKCENIFFAGWLDNIQMVSLMSIAKCGVFSIKNTFDFKDTFNNKAIQYISEGLPILNSLSGFAKTLIAENNMGVTYDCDNVSDCKEKILQLYHDEDSRIHMGQNAFECFNEMFDTKVVNRQFEEYLITMCDKYEKEFGNAKYRGL